MSEISPERRVVPISNDFIVSLDGGHVDLSKATEYLLNESPTLWSDLFLACRESVGRPDFSGNCELIGVTIHPFGRVDTRSPAIGLTGLFNVFADVKAAGDEIVHLTRHYAEDDPIVLDIDTHAGNFDYFSGMLDGGNHRIIEFSEQLSVHVAHIMTDYYRSIPRTGLNGL